MSSVTARTEWKTTLFVGWRNQISRIFPTLVIALSVVLILLSAAFLLSRIMGVTAASLTRDPDQVAKLGPYTGMISTLGIMCWTATVTICFGMASLLRQDSRFRQAAFFLFITGLFSLILDIDDAFMFHDVIIPYDLHIPQILVFLVYLLMFAGYGIYFFRRFLQTDYLLLMAALFFLGLSAGIDQLIPFNEFLEDCFKFTGIVLWLAYFSRTALSIVQDYFQAIKETRESITS